MRFKLIIILLIFSILKSYATHQRAAQITYIHKNGYTYDFTVTMYTRTSSPADDVRDYMPIKWGDGSEEEIPRVVWTDLGNDISLNIYKGTHTFPGNGIYTISVEDPNRNNGVVNIPNSVNVPMYVESVLVINQFLGANNSVQLTNPPIDKGCVNKLYVHNPAAYDPDGDSLSYELVKCKGQGGYDIPGYTFPKATDYFTLDPITGDLIWKNPYIQGEYNVAFVIKEWRAGYLVGSVRRDMQINIVTCDHDPPVFDTVKGKCVLAGDFLSFPVSATDPEGTDVEITAYGGPFYVSQSPAIINPDPGTGHGTATTEFYWVTHCSHIRKNYYQAVFKASDFGTPVNLVSFMTVPVKVISPPPENLTLEPLGNSINITWDIIECTNAFGYNIYRKESSSNWEPAECETGVPENSGFQLIKKIDGRKINFFNDNNNGEGLNQGILYCYRITARYYDVESKTSEQVCTYLKRDAPIITNVTNDSMNMISGKVKIIWSKPTELDLTAHPGPYKYHLLRNNGLLWDNPEEIAVLNGLTDTTYFDKDVNINENSKPYSYRVDLYNESEGYLNSSTNAASVFINLSPYNNTLKLDISAKVPWINEKYIIYRKDPDSTRFNIIDTTFSNIYYDRGLKNFEKYCYYVKSVGYYSLSGIIKPLINFSHISCGIPMDIIPPCKPLLWVNTDCDNITNELTWSLPYDSCNFDVAKYVIYYSTPGLENMLPLDSIENPFDTTFLHDNINKVIGCYGVIAVDTTGNRSEMSDIICVNYDACPSCVLPNVFTPNGDNINDFLVPKDNPEATVDYVELHIYNRWGKKVYYTEDPNVKWDGKDMNTKKLLPDGTYFYICKAHVLTNDGEIITNSQGSVTIFTGAQNR
jgi:gliding motility-associated-like protein